MLKRSSRSNDPHAMALGRRGGQIGGRARAASLSPARRREIAIAAARARWEKPATATPQERDAATTKNRILEAARQEFTQRGLDGGKLDRIAASAGVNKRTIYAHFGSKRGLFREMFSRNITRIAEGVEPAAVANAAGDQLLRWQELIAANPEWLRLSMWEALGDEHHPYAAEKARRAFWSDAVSGLAALQHRPGLAEPGSAAQLQLTILAAAMIPHLLPQLAHLITGLDPASPEFCAARAEHLQELGALLGSVQEPPH